MVVSPCIDWKEAASEDGGQAIGIVAEDRQTAASLGTVRSECADDDVSLGLNSHFEPIDVSGLIGAIGEEVKGGPVVPQIISLNWLPLCDICDHPLDVGGAVTKTPLGCVKRGSGKIENRGLAKLSSEQIVHQA